METWLGKYGHFLDEWVHPLYEIPDERESLELENICRVRVALLDVGYCDKDMAISGAKERIKENRSFVKGVSHMGESCGYGTHALTLLLTVAPQADIFVAKIAKDHKDGEDSVHAAEAVAEVIFYPITTFSYTRNC
jgi:hypothetical protein